MELIVAVDSNWAIGKGGELLVSIPQDKKFFHDITSNNVIILGRKTLATFPNGVPLAGRDNIILSKNKKLSVRGGLVVNSEEELFTILKDIKDKRIFVVGGEQVYRMLLPYCSKAYVTKIDYEYQADTYFPNLDEMENWKVIEESDENTYFSLEYYFYVYENVNPKTI